MSCSLPQSLLGNMASSLSLLVLVLCSLTATQATLRVFNLRATGLPSDSLGITDGYVKLFCGAVSLGKTSILHNQVNPWWEEEFVSLTAQENDILRMEVLDSDLIFDDKLGFCQRQLVRGTYDHQCILDEGGSLYYSYTLN